MTLSPHRMILNVKRKDRGCVINEIWNVILPTDLRGNVTSCVHFLECTKILPKCDLSYSSLSLILFNKSYKKSLFEPRFEGQLIFVLIL